MNSAGNFRKLAAIDIVFLGYKLIFAEYACGAFLSIALGLFVWFRGHTRWQVALGIYLLCLGLNYLPLLAFTISIASQENARREMAGELTEPRRAMSKYRRLSLLLLVPMLVPALVLVGKRQP